MNQLLAMALLIGISVTLIRYAIALFMKAVIPHKLKALQDYSLEPTVSILLPCYNEGHTVYETIESICNSDYPIDKFEIIAVDDCSVDGSYEWMLKAQQDFPQVKMRISQNAINSGKVRSVAIALAQARSELIISIDSDCIFAKDCMRELVSCFIDPEIGAVGGQIGIRNPGDNWFTMGQVLWYYLAFNAIKTPEIYTRATTCISGCLFAIRRRLMNKIMPVALNRKFLGAHVVEGEDRFMTHMVLLYGFKNYINIKARCWTTAPNTFQQLFKQQLRWRRSALRDIFFTLGSLRYHYEHVHPNYAYTVAISFTTMIAATILLMTAPLGNFMFLNEADRWVWGFATAAVLSLVIKKYAPEQTIPNPLKLMAFSVWSIVDCVFITPLALCTLHIGDWGTRDKTLEESNAS